jgi:PBSX family phage terminase large subunit
MFLSDKQKEYINNANHRYNIKIGATRSGKTYLDILYVIPKRIRERAGKDGLNVILGVTNSTIERNVLVPLREKYGDDLVSSINAKNIATIFGEPVYCLGAEKVNQVSKIRGSSIKYCYCDELAEYNEEVFELLKSRLDKEYSMVDATLNPAHTNHWLKVNFLDIIEEKGIDAFVQSYTIFDNPFLPKDFVDNLCKEYEGTVFYNRYILGQWCNAEGLIYKRFADNPSRYKWIKRKEDGSYDLPAGITIIGIDYGGNKSGQAFVCTRISSDYKYVIALGSEFHKGDIDPDKLFELQYEFALKMMYKYNTNIDYMLPDNEEVVLIRGLKNGMLARGVDTVVRGCVKEEINERIDCERMMISYDIFYYIEEECDTLVNALCSALWDGEEEEDVRLDDLTTDIDTLDAFEYSFTRYMRKINDMIERRRKVNV